MTFTEHTERKFCDECGHCSCSQPEAHGRCPWCLETLAGWPVVCGYHDICLERSMRESDWEERRQLRQDRADLLATDRAFPRVGGDRRLVGRLR